MSTTTMPLSQSPAVAVSAPGKVLFAGGFLVLDRQHTGLVFGLNARIHVCVKSWIPSTAGEDENGRRSTTDGRILVRSPQFRNAAWLYEIGGDSVNNKNEGENEGEAVRVVQVLEDLHQRRYTTTANKFVETTLRYALTYLRHRSVDVLRRSIEVTILADDDYYSQPQSQSQAQTPSETLGRSRPEEESVDGQYQFTDFGVQLSDAHKTGLGSSAALTTALVGALLAYFLPAESTKTLPYKTIHNLAQAAHCAAQGKVGSGFDVAAAVYGSCLYRRFTPAILESVGDPESKEFGERLHRCVDDLDLQQKWDVEVTNRAVEVPEGLLLVMCDVDCGSETPAMVRNVLKWKREKADEATLLWTALQQGTEDLCRELRRLSAVNGIGSEEYRALGDIIMTVRSLVREMSAKSSVPIEPPVITELLDFCTSLPGVIGGVAPGAGGYDAVALLLRANTKVVQDLEARLQGWKSKDASGATIGKVRLLGVKQDKEGVRLEQAINYQR